MLHWCHSVFCSSHILVVYKNKDIIYDFGQMPEFVQHMVGLHITSGQFVFIVWCNFLLSGRNRFEMDAMCGNSLYSLLSECFYDGLKPRSFVLKVFWKMYQWGRPNHILHLYNLLYNMYNICIAYMHIILNGLIHTAISWSCCDSLHFVAGEIRGMKGLTKAIESGSKKNFFFKLLI